MNGFKKFSPLVTALLVLSCLSQKEKLGNLATALSLQEELTEAVEAVVWLRDPMGNLSSHWIKNDVSGVIVIASRAGGVVPIQGALWRFPTEDTLDDYDWLILEDLVSGETLSIPLDDEVTSDVDETYDGGVADGGERPDIDSTDDDSAGDAVCDIRAIQSLPVLLGGVGPYLFAQYNEKQYDCEDTLMSSEDRYVTVDLVAKEAVDILTDEELEQLNDTPELHELEKEGTIHYLGSTPVYDGNMSPLLSHIFATRAAFLQEDGDRHAVVSSMEILGKTLPKALAPFKEAPELVRAFQALYPIAVPAGWWPIIGEPERIRNQLAAFGVSVE